MDAILARPAPGRDSTAARREPEAFRPPVPGVCFGLFFVSVQRPIQHEEQPKARRPQHTDHQGVDQVDAQA